MRLRNVIPLAVLFAIGVLLIAVNLLTASARSGFSRSIDGTVVSKEMRREKHAGVDDVCHLRFEDGSRIQVEPALFAIAREGGRMQKDSWDWSISVDGDVTVLDPTPQMRGMFPVMVLTMAMLFGMSVFVCRHLRRERDSEATDPGLSR